MDKHKVLIQLFPMVDDIDQLEKVLLLLRQNATNIDMSKFYIILDVTYPLSDYFINWDKSILKKDFFIQKFEILKKYGDWCDESYFTIDENVRGCVDMCINNIYKHDVDDVIMLDNDMVFNPYTLHIMLESSLEVKNKYSNYVITPEYVKIWDNTWDVIVNDNFKDKPNNPFYVLTNDPVEDSISLYGDVTLEPLGSNVFKFGGGWFTLYSKKLLDAIEFPKDIKGYGVIDTIIMEFCKIIPNTVQYKVKNLVVCEDRKYLGKSAYSSYLSTIDRKEEHKQETYDKMIKHLKTKYEASKSR